MGDRLLYVPERLCRIWALLNPVVTIKIRQDVEKRGRCRKVIGVGVLRLFQHPMAGIL